MPSTPLLHLWTLRVGWLGLPLTVAPTIKVALEMHSSGVAWVSAIFLWALWGLGLLCLLVIKPITLTGIRLIAMVSFAVALLAAFDGEVNALALIWSGLIFGWSLMPTIGGLYIDGDSYGDERRFALKAPGQLLLGPIQLVAVLMLIGSAAGPLALGAQAWVIGALLLIGGWAMCFQGLRIMHQLTQRWLIFVPSGIVVKDPMQLVDPLRVHKSNLHSIDAAKSDTDATDLTYNSLGKALEIVFIDPEPVALATGTAETVSAAIVTPSLLKDALAEAKIRGFGGTDSSYDASAPPTTRSPE